MLRFGRLEIDVNARQVRVDGRICELTSYQFDILQVMARSPGGCSRATRSWMRSKGHPIEAFDRSIDVHVSRIRAAIEDDPKNPRRIPDGARGSGYVFARKQDADAPEHAFRHALASKHRVRSLYLRIYLTVVVVLLVFALIAAVLFRRHARGRARPRFEARCSSAPGRWRR